MRKKKPEPEVVQLSGLDAQQFVVELLRRAIRPHAEEIERLGPGNILAVVYEPSQ
jgi:hypothetical protein